MNKGKIPKRRFKEFQNADAWEQRELGDVADIIGGGTPRTENPEYWDGDIDWYAPAEIADQIYVKTSQRKITEQGYDNSSAKLLPPGTVLFTSRAGIGKTAILARKGCTNQGFQSIVPHKNELDTYFIFSRTEELKRYGELVGAGSTFVEVSGKQMAAMNLMLPSTIREQQTIGAFFKKIDNLITLHQRKLEKLKNLKLAYLSEMFPAEGERKPKRRFSGFTGDWKQRKLGELVNICSGKDYRHLSEGDIPVYGTGGYMLSVNEALSYDKDAIGIGRKGTINAPYILKSPFWTVDTLFYALPRKEVDLNFAFDIFQNIDWKREDESTGVPSLSKGAINEINIFVPQYDEQHKIGTYFRSLDNLITLHQRKLEKLQNLKKAYLNEMFV